jgi:hypothetical protein
MAIVINAARNVLVSFIVLALCVVLFGALNPASQPWLIDNGWIFGCLGLVVLLAVVVAEAQVSNPLPGH